MSDICLHRANPQRLPILPRVLEHRRNGLHLDGITSRRPRAVGLEIRRLRRVETCSYVASAYQLFLRLAAGCRDGLGLAVLVDAALTDNGADGVAIPQCIV